MKNTHCCQCGEVRPLVTQRSDGFSFHDILFASSVRPITEQLFNEQHPSMIISAQVYRNGGCNKETHICGACQVEALKIIRREIDAVIESVEQRTRGSNHEKGTA